MKTTLFTFLLGICLFGCHEEDTVQMISPHLFFGTPQKVTITGYDGVIMEPFITRDDSKLFFNNSNSATNTDLHWAKKIDDTTFEYMGLIGNVNTTSLEGVPTMDVDNNFYFVSTRSYNQDFSTLYKGTYQTGAILDISLVENISKQEPGLVNFDIEVSNDGNYLFMVDGTYDVNGGPYTANFVLIEKSGTNYERSSNSDYILQNINTDNLEYAAGISADGLELYFTRIKAPINANSQARIYYSVRASDNVPFPIGNLLEEADGFVEGPTLSGDGQRLYYHKREGDTFSLFMARKE